MGWIALWFAAALSNASDTTYPLQVPAERSVTEIRKDLRVAMKAEAPFRSRKGRADGMIAGSEAHVDSIARLLGLHCEMVRHSTFVDGFALRESRSLLQSRLVRIARAIERDTAKQPAAKPGSKVIPAIFELIPVLAQRLGQAGGGGGPAGAGGGGIGAGGQGGFQAAGQLPDFGPDLVNLIQRVISPETWEDVGGPSTIVYYAPLHAIVVRGTMETHERIIQLLWDLRAAGGP